MEIRCAFQHLTQTAVLNWYQRVEGKIREEQTHLGAPYASTSISGIMVSLTCKVCLGCSPCQGCPKLDKVMVLQETCVGMKSSSSEQFHPPLFKFRTLYGLEINMLL